MTEIEMQLVNAIRNSKDPAKATAIAVNVIVSFLEGECPESIAESYGLVKTDTGYVMA